MQHTKLRKTDISVSRLTFGCWELGGGQWEKQSDDINIQAIQKAYEWGIHTYDTAEGYGLGHSESILGTALEGKRTECVIASKVSPNHLKPDDVRRSAEDSLRRLQTDYMDIYYIHWPNKDIPLKDTLTAFNKLKDEKMIKAIGVSNFSTDQLKEASLYAQIDALQPEYSLLHRDIELNTIPYCEENNIAIMTYSSIAKGILTGAYHFGHAEVKEEDFRKTRRLFLPDHLEKETELVHKVKSVADNRGVSMAEVAIAWLLHQKTVTSAIVGTQNLSHLESNINAVNLKLTENELTELSNTSSKVIKSIDG